LAYVARFSGLVEEEEQGLVQQLVPHLPLGGNLQWQVTG
jgi:hypothetical protein